MAKTPKKSGTAPLAPSKYAGERLGLPETGHQSVARVGRRVVALLIDWVSAILLTMLITGTSYIALASSNAGQLTILAVFVCLQVLGIWAIGGSMGHRLCGLYLVNVHGGSLDPWRPVVRSVLLGLVIPALVWDSDQRGFHDKMAGTILLRSK
jgi:uncharacterized RDD family membrane protein YckC